MSKSKTVLIVGGNITDLQMMKHVQEIKNADPDIVILHQKDPGAEVFLTEDPPLPFDPIELMPVRIKFPEHKMHYAEPDNIPVPKPYRKRYKTKR